MNGYGHYCRSTRQKSIKYGNHLTKAGLAAIGEHYVPAVLVCIQLKRGMTVKLKTIF